MAIRSWRFELEGEVLRITETSGRAQLMMKGVLYTGFGSPGDAAKKAAAEFARDLGPQHGIEWPVPRDLKEWILE
jgi:hypothetical protein